MSGANGLNSVVPGGVWGGVGWGLGRNGDWASNVVLYLAHFWSYHAWCVTIEGLRLTRLLGGRVHAAGHSRVVRIFTNFGLGTAIAIVVLPIFAFVLLRGVGEVGGGGDQIGRW